MLPSLEEIRSRQVSQHARRSRECCAVQDSRADLDALEELIDLFVRELLAKARQDVAELADANVSASFAVKHPGSKQHPRKSALRPARMSTWH